MRLIEAVSLAAKNIVSSKTRTLLTMLGIIIGVAAVIVIVGLGNGLENYVSDSFSSMGTNTLNVSVSPRGSTRTLDVDGMYRIVAENSQYLEACSPTTDMFGSLKIGSKTLTFTSVKGVSEDYLQINSDTIVQGRGLQYSDMAGRGKVCVIGTYLNMTCFGGNGVGQTRESIPVRYEWEAYYDIRFSDGGAEVTLFGFYEFRFMQIALFTALGLSFFIFFLIVMLGIRKSMRYIRLLGKEIGILEGGNLDYQVTIQGRDELADLAKGLDCMRQAFQAQTEHEREITQTNQRMVTEMSHDLRTPLTSIMLYTELLRQHKYDSPEKQAEYLEKIDRKARQMKQLSDRLFEYSLITGETRVAGRTCASVLVSVKPRLCIVRHNRDKGFDLPAGCVDTQVVIFFVSPGAVGEELPVGSPLPVDTLHLTQNTARALVSRGPADAPGHLVDNLLVVAGYAQCVGQTLAQLPAPAAKNFGQKKNQDGIGRQTAQNIDDDCLLRAFGGIEIGRDHHIGGHCDKAAGVHGHGLNRKGQGIRVGAEEGADVSAHKQQQNVDQNTADQVDGHTCPKVGFQALFILGSAALAEQRLQSLAGPQKDGHSEGGHIGDQGVGTLQAPGNGEDQKPVSENVAYGADYHRRRYQNRGAVVAAEALQQNDGEDQI